MGNIPRDEEYFFWVWRKEVLQLKPWSTKVRRRSREGLIPLNLLSTNYVTPGTSGTKPNHERDHTGNPTHWVQVDDHCTLGSLRQSHTTKEDVTFLLDPWRVSKPSRGQLWYVRESFFYRGYTDSFTNLTDASPLQLVDSSTCIRHLEDFDMARVDIEVSVESELMVQYQCIMLY